MTVAEAVVESKSMAEAVRVTREAQRRGIRQWKGRLLQEALEMFVTKHLGCRWQRRRGPTPWVCLGCGPREAQQLKRNGHYSRQLLVLEGIVTLRVPQLRCLNCGKSVALDARFLPPRRRFWGDLDQRLTEAYLSGASYRQVKALLERRVASNVGLMSLWRRFQQQALHAKAPTASKPLRALYLDEVYLRIGGRPQWGLLALGEADDGTRHYLGASLTSQRSQQEWQKLLDSLKAPGWGQGLVVIHDGDQAIAQAVAMVLPQAQERCCLWHQLQGLIRGAREQFPQDAPRRWEVIQRGKQALEAACPQMPRTTSPLERAIKELRRRIRPMDGFGSQAGATNFLHAWMVKENVRCQGQDWLETFGV